MYGRNKLSNIGATNYTIPTMKKASIFLVLIMLFGSVTAFAGDDDDDRRRRRRRRRGGGATMEIGINPIGYLFGQYNVIGGMHFSEESSLFVEIAYNNNSYPYTTVDTNGFPVATDVVYSGFSIAPEYRYYFSPNEGNDAWFIGGYLKMRFTSTDGKPYAGVDIDDEFVAYDLSNFAIAPGITVGYEWLTRSGLTITLWTGFGYSLIYTETKDPDFTPSEDPIFGVYNAAVEAVNKLDARGGFTLGYRFGQ